MEVPEPIDKRILNIIQYIYSPSPEHVEIWHLPEYGLDL